MTTMKCAACADGKGTQHHHIRTTHMQPAHVIRSDAVVPLRPACQLHHGHVLTLIEASTFSAIYTKPPIPVRSHSKLTEVILHKITRMTQQKKSTPYPSSPTIRAKIMRVAQTSSYPSTPLNNLQPPHSIPSQTLSRRDSTVTSWTPLGEHSATPSSDRPFRTQPFQTRLICIRYFHALQPYDYHWYHGTPLHHSLPPYSPSVPQDGSQSHSSSRNWNLAIAHDQPCAYSKSALLISPSS